MYIYYGSTEAKHLVLIYKTNLLHVLDGELESGDYTEHALINLTRSTSGNTSVLKMSVAE